MVLPSDSSNNYYPDNTLTDYKTKLPAPISLSEGWRVGVSELQIPLTFTGINAKELFIITRNEGEYDDENIVEAKFKTYPVQAGRFGPRDQIRKMFENVPGEVLRVTENHDTHRVKMVVGNENIFLSQGLMEFLGGTFHPEGSGPYGREFWKLKTYRGVDPVRYSAGLERIYVYCDIVNPRIVGNTRAELLTTVPSPVPKDGDFGELLTIRFTDIRYLEIGKNFIENIRITLRDDLGREITFLGGKVLVELAFKKQ